LKAKVVLMAKELVWLVGVLVCVVLVIGAVIPAAISVTSNFNVQGTSTGELFTGAAATANTMTYKPIVSVTAFKKAAIVTTYNDTKKAISGSTVVNVLIDSYAAHGGVAWEGVNVTFTMEGLNTTNTIRWVTGGCNVGANKTWTSSPQTYSDIASTCLTPGANLAFTFVNVSDGLLQNVTNVSVTYLRYVDNTAYTLDSGAGKITPTLAGYYYATYTYGTGVTASTLALVILLPLLIAVVLFMLFMKSSGMF
jgi:hypothetical protein